MKKNFLMTKTIVYSIANQISNDFYQNSGVN